MREINTYYKRYLSSKLSVWIAILIVIVVGARVNAQKIFSEQMFEYDTTLFLDNNIKDLYIEYFDGV